MPPGYTMPPSSKGHRTSLVNGAVFICGVRQGVDDQPVQFPEFLLASLIPGQLPAIFAVPLHSTIIGQPEQVGEQRIGEVQAGSQLDFGRYHSRFVRVLLSRPLPGSSRCMFPEIDSRAQPVVAVLTGFPFVEADSAREESVREVQVTPMITNHRSREYMNVPEYHAAGMAEHAKAQDAPGCPRQQSAERKLQPSGGNLSSTTPRTSRILWWTNQVYRIESHSA